MSRPPSERALPLDGVRVLDLSGCVPGAFCTMLLADFGADVVKLEHTRGGERAGPIGHRYKDGESPLWRSLNRGKRSVAIDLEHARGRELFSALLGVADVLLDDSRPGTRGRLGVSLSALADADPRLICCTLTGYGRDGPAAGRAGHDINQLALTGALALTGELDGPPIIPAIPIAELAGGALMAVIGILLALAERARSGSGQLVDASIYDGTLALMIGDAARYFATGSVSERGTAPRGGGKACYQAYLAKDGWVTLGAIEPEFWQAFCEGIERPDLIEHHGADTDSWAHGQLELIFLRRTRAEWKAFADRHGCCLEPVLGLDEALDSELTGAREMVVALAGGPTARALGVPVKLSATPGDPARLRAPRVGEHTVEVLREAGLDTAAIEALLSEGAIEALPGEDPTEVLLDDGATDAPAACQCARRPSRANSV